MKISLIISVVALVLTNILNASCKKSCTNVNKCDGVTKPSGQFVFKELVGDTSFVADTVFRDNYVKIQALDSYESVTWTVDNDPTSYTQPEFSLSFINLLGTINVDFKGARKPNTDCFPNDNGLYTSSKSLTVLEQTEKPFRKFSPLIGRYHGAFSDNPLDTFTTRIEFFDSTKYDVSITGSKSFYWLSNMPKGYTSTLDWPYQELKNGQSVDMGYKSFQFGTSTSQVQGKGWLSNDTLFINYGNDLIGRRKFIGKKL